MNFCWVIPHYNHVGEFISFLPRLVDAGLPCIVVDDGSATEQIEQLSALLAGHELITLLKHSHNKGKGAAVFTGCDHARTVGYTHIIQIDADGQHDPADVSRFIVESQKNPAAIVSGLPIFDESAPFVRKYGRKITTFWISLETLSLQVKDGLCGYRVYPLDAIDQLTSRFNISVNMQFDTDIMVKSVWLNIPIVFIDTQVQYVEGGTSHFHYLRDNVRLIRLHAGLLFQSVLILPGTLKRRMRG